MSRLAPLDKALVLILVPLWVVCFGLGMRSVIHDGAEHPLMGLRVEAADQYPTFTGESAFVVDPLVHAGLRPGDRLVRVGDADLRGVGTFGFAWRSLEEAGRNDSIPLVFERGGERRETSLGLNSRRAKRRSFLAAGFALAASALFLLLRGQPTPMVRAYFYLAMCWALNIPFHHDRWEFAAWVGIFVVTTGLFFPLAFRFVFRFPDDRVPEGRWHRSWPWSFVVLGLFVGFSEGLFPGLAERLFSGLGPSSAMAIGTSGVFVIGSLGQVLLLAVATLKYRRADQIARRQMKWVLFGLYCVVLPVGIALAEWGLFDSRRLWFASFWAVPILPISLLISVARFNLFDIDRILSATASYNVLAVVLGGGALIGVPRIAEAASGLLGVDPGTSQIVLSLALAATVIPAHRRLRPQIDRVFFKERYALDHGIAELLPTLSACTDARELTEHTGEGLHRLLRPEACIVYAAVEGSYTPVFVEGRAVPPAFGATSPLVASLEERPTPLSLSAVGRRPDEAALGPFDRAALETLQAEVVLPVRQGDALAAFLCLGPKRSGDVYTSTDLSLLAAIAETVSHQLQRFDQESVTREAQAMQQALRRYVPGAIAEQLGSGGDLTSGERQVSVLFVDIRGYTGFAESRKAEEIFSTVNRYTEAVSRIVQEHAGSVVEFNGDGMMAVFGAPRELAHKERAAVEAGREIVEAVSALPVEGGESLSVGVGIATGEAFVGNIQAVDRMIWSAIGNTTNLAARLQGLTRELDATLVIDCTTWERGQAAVEGFEKRPAVAIRGRRESQDLYALSIRATGRPPA